MRSTLVALSLLVFSTSCAMRAAALPEAEFKPTGEVSLYDRTISFDSTRVRSAQCNMTQRSDGSWGGVLDQRPLDVSVTPTRITGVDFNLTRDTSQPGKFVITGQFQGRIYRFELDDQQAMIRAPSKSLTLPGRLVGENQTSYGAQANLQLRGEAGAENPPWPQIAFALVAMMH